MVFLSYYSSMPKFSYYIFHFFFGTAKTLQQLSQKDHKIPRKLPIIKISFVVKSAASANRTLSNIDDRAFCKNG